jgi:hypothetical protein
MECQLCQLPTKNLEMSTRHTELWHRPRKAWFCPTTTEQNPLFRTYETAGGFKDACLCCNESFDLNDQESDAIFEHLKSTHNFSEHPCLVACFDKQQFYLHLASHHGIYLEFIRDFMKTYKLRPRAPATLLELSGSEP